MRVLLLLPLCLVLGCPHSRVYPDGRGIEGQLEREVIALRAQLRAVGGAGSCADASEPSRLYHDLVQIYSGSEVEVSQGGGFVDVLLPGSLLFSQAKGVTLRDESKGTLDLLATALKVHPEGAITLQVYTDDRSPSLRIAPSNLDLTHRQGMAVFHRLSDDFGVSAARFAIEAHGENHPRVPNDTESSQRQNRRVRVHIAQL